MTVTHVADALAALIGAGIIFVGLRFLLVPRPAAAAASIPIGDTLIVLRYRGSKAVAYGIHGATAVAMVVIAGLLLSR
jgi:hypothetical protein